MGEGGEGRGGKEGLMFVRAWGGRCWWGLGVGRFGFYLIICFFLFLSFVSVVFLSFSSFIFSHPQMFFSQVIYLEVDQSSGEIKEKSRTKLDQDISCLDITPFTNNSTR